jgi:hypothetical protein
MLQRKWRVTMGAKHREEKSALALSLKNKYKLKIHFLRTRVWALSGGQISKIIAAFRTYGRAIHTDGINEPVCY